MRVAVMADRSPQAAEGTSMVVRDLARGLEEAGCDVRVLALDSKVPSPSFLLRLRRARVDAGVYTPRSGLTAAALLRAQLLAAVTPALAIQILQADAEPTRVRAVLRPPLAIFPSQRLGDVAGVGLRYAVVPNGVDRTRFAPQGEAAAGFWPEKSGPRLLHVGHLRESRNLSVLSELAAHGGNVLLVASPDTEPDRGLLRRLEKGGVTVLCDRVSDIAALYRAADVYVFPVVDARGCIETPISVLESLAVGTPIVATPFGSLPEWKPKGLVLADPAEFVDAVFATAVSPPPVDPDAVPDLTKYAGDVLHAVCCALSPGENGRLVVLLGLDGAGKTTQAQLLATEAAARGVDAVTVWSRWKPFILRPMMTAARRASTAQGASRSRAYEQEMSFKRRIFRLALVRHIWEWLASLDHGVQTIPRIMRARRTAALVIADRYYHDALVDMGANFGSHAPHPRGLFRLFPQPDRVIVLDAPAEVAFERKDDVPSLDYLRQRRPLYLELAERNGWPVVDASSSAEEVHAQLSAIVWSDS